MFNSVTIAGRVHGEASLRTSQAGKPFLNCKIRGDRPGRGDLPGEYWILNVSAFGEAANTIARSKGALLVIAGRLKTETWQHEGQERATLKLVAEHVVIDAKGAPAAAASTPPSAPPAQRPATAPASSPATALDEPPF